MIHTPASCFVMTSNACAIQLQCVILHDREDCGGQRAVVRMADLMDTNHGGVSVKAPEWFEGRKIRSVLGSWKSCKEILAAADV